MCATDTRVEFERTSRRIGLPVMVWRVYAYAGCGACRRALKFLEAAGVTHEVIPIREHPPTEKELRLALATAKGDLRRLFNTAGRDYRELSLASRLPKMTLGDALALLTVHGNLVKRPFVVAGRYAWTGFDEAAWRGRLQAACP
jgi:arsenate reductase